MSWQTKYPDLSSWTLWGGAPETKAWSRIKRGLPYAKTAGKFAAKGALLGAVLPGEGADNLIGGYAALGAWQLSRKAIQAKRPVSFAVAAGAYGVTQGISSLFGDSEETTREEVKQRYNSETARKKVQANLSYYLPNFTSHSTANKEKASPVSKQMREVGVINASKLMKTAVSDALYTQQELANLAGLSTMGVHSNALIQVLDKESAKKELLNTVKWRNKQHAKQVTAVLTEPNQLGAMGVYYPGLNLLGVNALLDPRDIGAVLGQAHSSSNDKKIAEWTARVTSPRAFKETTLHEGLHAVWDLDMDPAHKARFMREAKEQVSGSSYGEDVSALAEKAPVYAELARKATLGDIQATESLANEMWAHRGVLKKYKDTGYTLGENKELDAITAQYVNWNKSKLDITPEFVGNNVEAALMTGGLTPRMAEYHRATRHQRMLPIMAGFKFSGKDDNYNTIEGLRHQGMASNVRRNLTEFGSGYRGMSKFAHWIKNIFKRKPDLPAFTTGAMQTVEALPKGYSQKEIIELAKHARGSTVEEFAERMGVEFKELGELGKIAGGGVNVAPSRIMKATPEEDLIITLSGLSPGKAYIDPGYYRDKLVKAGLQNNIKAQRQLDDVLKSLIFHESTELQNVYGMQRSLGKQLGGRLPQHDLAVAQEELFVRSFGDKEIYKRFTLIRERMDPKYKGYKGLGRPIQPNNPINLIPGKDDAYNTIEGLRHDGLAPEVRKVLTEFGSGWAPWFAGAAVVGAGSAYVVKKFGVDIIRQTGGESIESAGRTSRRKERQRKEIRSRTWWQKFNPLRRFQKRGGDNGGFDDKYNTIEGLRHGGMSESIRKKFTEFGSGFDPLRKIAVEIFKDMSKTAAYSRLLKSKRFSEALKAGTKVKSIGKGAYGEATLFEASVEGHKFQYVSKQANVFDKNFSAINKRNIESVKKEYQALQDISGEIMPAAYGENLGSGRFFMEHMPGAPVRELHGIGTSLPKQYIEQQLQHEMRNVAGKGYANIDINMGNVLFDPKTKRVSWIDFGAASRVSDTETAIKQMTGSMKMGQELIGWTGNQFSGFDDAYNTIKGFKEAGLAPEVRHGLTEFGSGWTKAISKLFASPKKRLAAGIIEDIPLWKTAWKEHAVGTKEFALAEQQFVEQVMRGKASAAQDKMSLIGRVKNKMKEVFALQGEQRKIKRLAGATTQMDIAQMPTLSATKVPSQIKVVTSPVMNREVSDGIMRSGRAGRILRESSYHINSLPFKQAYRAGKRHSKSSARR